MALLTKKGIVWSALLLAFILSTAVLWVQAAPRLDVHPNTNTTVDLTAANYLKDFFTWSKTVEHAYRYGVTVAAVSNNINGVASYAEGFLTYDTNQDVLSGQLKQFFNDRRYSGYGINPFDPNKTDQVKFTINPNGNATITLLNWGSGVMQVKFHCENGVLYGFTSPGQPNLWAISLKKTRQDIIY